jgi:hypothetical protein
MQSGAWCFPNLAVIAKNNKDTYEKYLRAIFKFGEELRHDGFNDNCEGWRQFKVSEPHDMKSYWLCLKRGGTMKAPGIIHFCHLCQCRSNDIALPNMVPCLFDFRSDGKNRCFHLPVIVGACIAQSKIELAKLARCPVAQQVVRACLAGDINYYNLYNNCKLHLLRNG